DAAGSEPLDGSGGEAIGGFFDLAAELSARLRQSPVAVEDAACLEAVKCVLPLIVVPTAIALHVLPGDSAGRNVGDGGVEPTQAGGDGGEDVAVAAMFPEDGGSEPQVGEGVTRAIEVQPAGGERPALVSPLRHR